MKHLTRIFSLFGRRCCVMSASACLAFSSGELAASVYDVRDFGAKGDGVTKDTEAIQMAIDKATAGGGGTVELPAGTYVSGTIWLKDNVDFHLCAGATLLGSPDKEDYNRPDAFAQNFTNSFETNSGAHLVLCVEQKNVTLRGPGKINGNGPHFVLDKDGKRFPRNAVTYSGIEWRPGQMLYFAESENVRIEDVELLDSPYWTCLVSGCTRVKIRGVYVKNHPLTHNGDGIDLDCSQYVSISDCHIDSSDDCITLRGAGRNLKKPQDMAFVTVSNCILRNRTCNAFRIGVGDKDIHDAVFSNVIVENARTAVMIGNGYASIRNQRTVRGTGVWNMRFNNLYVKHARELCLVVAQFSGGATTENIHFSNVHGSVDKESHVWGNAKFPFKNITFSNVDVDSEIEAVNVDGFVISGGRLREKTLSPESRAKLSDDIANYRKIIF